MDTFCYHVPHLYKLYGSLKKFTGQAIEKANDDIKKIYKMKTNKWDGAKEALVVRKRVEGETLTRQKRKYTKDNEQYWKEELPEKRKKNATRN